MAIAYFQHTPIGKKTQAKPYTAVAAARYIMRLSAAAMICTAHMPAEYRQILGYLKNHEDTIRANGRVVDKFIIAIPREFTQEQARQVLYRYGHRLGQGKAPFAFAFHWEENNPHAHMIFIDRDPETGKRVAMTSDRNSTQRLKLEWEDEVNTLFHELGREERIDFVANQQKKLEQSESELTDPEEAMADEPDMEVVFERQDRVKQAVEFYEELKNLQHVKARLETTTEQLNVAVTQLEKSQGNYAAAIAQHSVCEQRLNAMKTELSRYQKANGSLRGFNILGWKTPTRRAGEEAKNAVTTAEHHLEFAERDMVEAEKEMSFWQSSRESATLTKETAENEVNQITSVYGEKTTLDEAENLITFNMHANMQDVTPKDLLQMVQDGILSEGEYIDALEIINTPEAQQLLYEWHNGVQELDEDL